MGVAEQRNSGKNTVGAESLIPLLCSADGAGRGDQGVVRATSGAGQQVGHRHHRGGCTASFSAVLSGTVTIWGVPLQVGTLCAYRRWQEGRTHAADAHVAGVCSHAMG